jgi:hypothetical protein
MPDDYSALLKRLRDLERRMERTGTIDRARPIVARAETATALNIPNNTLTIVQYDTITFDPLSLITTGAAWKFTAPIAGYYFVRAAAAIQSTLTWAAGEAGDIRLYKNGAMYSALDRNDEMASGAVAQIKTLYGGDVVELAAGGTIDVRMVQSSGGALTLHPFAVQNYISIQRIN